MSRSPRAHAKGRASTRYHPTHPCSHKANECPSTHNSTHTYTHIHVRIPTTHTYTRTNHTHTYAPLPPRPHHQVPPLAAKGTHDHQLYAQITFPWRGVYLAIVMVYDATDSVYNRVHCRLAWSTHPVSSIHWRSSYCITSHFILHYIACSIEHVMWHYVAWLFIRN